MGQLNTRAVTLPRHADAVASIEIIQGFHRAKAEGKEARKQYQKLMKRQYKLDTLASLRWALDTPAPFAERWVQFWANHFTVSTVRKSVMGLTGAYEREAIRAHCMGQFEDLLLAVVRHPAMLLYLDNVRSVHRFRRRCLILRVSQCP